MAGICGAGLVDLLLTAGHGGAQACWPCRSVFMAPRPSSGPRRRAGRAMRIDGAVRRAGARCATSPSTTARWRRESSPRWRPCWWSPSWRRSDRRCSSARWPARSWRPSRRRVWWRLARCRAPWWRSRRFPSCAGWPTPSPARARWARTGFLLAALGAAARAGVRVRAVARRLAGAGSRAALCAGARRRARPRPRPLLVRAPGTALRARPARAPLGRPRFGSRVVAVVGLRWRWARAARGSPALRRPSTTARWGCAWALALARGLTDHDGDGFSARFGGGDCDDHRADVYPGAEDIPGDGIDQNCEGGDAKAVLSRRRAPSTPSAPAPPAPIKPRRPAPRSRATSSSSPSTPSAPIAWASRLRPPAGQVADADARRAGPARRLLPPRLVAGAQHAALVPVDPHQPRYPSRHRLGQADGELPATCCRRTRPSSRRCAARGLEAHRHLLALLFHRRPRHQPRRSPSGPTTAPAPSPSRTRTSPRRASCRA